MLAKLNRFLRWDPSNSNENPKEDFYYFTAFTSHRAVVIARAIPPLETVRSIVIFYMSAAGNVGETAKRQNLTNWERTHEQHQEWSSTEERHRQSGSTAVRLKDIELVEVLQAAEGRWCCDPDLHSKRKENSSKNSIIIQPRSRLCVRL